MLKFKEWLRRKQNGDLSDDIQFNIVYEVDEDVIHTVDRIADGRRFQKDFVYGFSNSSFAEITKFHDNRKDITLMIFDKKGEIDRVRIEINRFNPPETL